MWSLQKIPSQASHLIGRKSVEWNFSFKGSFPLAATKQLFQNRYSRRETSRDLNWKAPTHPGACRISLSSVLQGLETPWHCGGKGAAFPLHAQHWGCLHLKCTERHCFNPEQFTIMIILLCSILECVQSWMVKLRHISRSQAHWMIFTHRTRPCLYAVHIWKKRITSKAMKRRWSWQHTRKCADQHGDLTDIFNSASQAVAPVCFKTTTITPVPEWLTDPLRVHFSAWSASSGYSWHT